MAITSTQMAANLRSARTSSMTAAQIEENRDTILKACELSTSNKAICSLFGLTYKQLKLIKQGKL